MEPQQAEVIPGESPQPPTGEDNIDQSGVPPIATPAETETETETEPESETVSPSPETPQTDEPTLQETDNQSSEAQLTEDSVANRAPIVAVSTNLLYDLAITPNFALEIPLGQRWSVLGEYTFPWWVSGNNRYAWESGKVDLGVRYWLSSHNPKDRMDVLKGHFVGLDLGAAYYDIEPGHTGWQGELQTAGLEYGYAWRLSELWRLEAYGALGWMRTHYRYYEGNTGDTHLLWKYNGHYTWWGPTKVGVSIKFIIPTKK